MIIWHPDVVADTKVETYLSSVYHEGLAYTLGYDDGLGKIELFGETFTNKDRAEASLAEVRRQSFWAGSTLFVVSLRVTEVFND